MKFFIIAVGNKLPDWINSGYQEYIKRLPREIMVNLIEVKPEKRTTGKTVEQLLSSEYQRIQTAIPPQCRIKVLDERGQHWTTKEFSLALQDWMDQGETVAFVIGGADGLHRDIKSTGNELIALSNLTLPHGLARVLLAEQIYRAVSIIKNHPYHRD
ncbi:23S rRNA (pseudouridine(1915)-N(3))-methyltransferase RlmH [Nitrosomonas sp.]|uniref:23S rRNA (pseudouridine(1915)-N(3))-methyltransferase RlmH n=1 Tax=Nitrosomonas sp. TaxID=42353 RepID=UPI001E03E701|nr:23S rRNA (pseudouridine(1915)-N(3))-methyltransferase RlmH [Nitrosomonas sp.]MBX3616808.1 23S rRNA (pseudouridine(1915)-N(3))-methyltransferase RlmH [Nitrosomonas sp.]